MLPFLLSLIITGIVAGQLIARVIGRYWYFLVIGPIPQAIGAGLLYTITPHSSGVNISGYQVLVGAGIGAVLQNSFIAMQAEFNDTPRVLGQASAMISFSQVYSSLLIRSLEFWTDHDYLFVSFLEARLVSLFPRLSSLPPSEITFTNTHPTRHRTIIRFDRV